MCGYLSRQAVGWARSFAVLLNMEKSNCRWKSGDKGRGEEGVGKEKGMELGRERERREEELNWAGEGEGINAMGKRWEEGKC